MRSPGANAELALLLEVTGTPKPGNVDRHHEYPDLRFEHFVTGAVGAREGFEHAESGAPFGESFEIAIEGMSQQSGDNTQFGAVLLVMPLVMAASRDRLDTDGASTVVSETTVVDTVSFYRAFDHVDVAVEEPPADLEPLDVRRGSDAVPAVRERDVALDDLMARSADVDGVAREWTEGFERTFDAAVRLADADGPVADRAASTFLELLAEVPDPFVAIQHDSETASKVSERAQEALAGAVDPDDLAVEFVAEGINPGTTADIVAGGLFVALERGLQV